MVKRLLRAALLEEGEAPEDSLRANVPYDVVELRAGLPFGARLAISRRPATRPGWVDYLEPAVAGDLDSISNQGSGAVLFVARDSRHVAFTFGRGSNLIEPARITSGFGLRVTLNAVDPDRVRAIDSRSFEDVVLSTSRQSSRNAELGTFGIDDSRDVLRAVTGAPRDPTLGSRIAGSDAVALMSDVPVERLDELADRLLELYVADDYKMRFGFIDYVAQVREPARRAELDGLLEAALGGDLSGLSMAPPERVDYEDLAGYRYPRERAGEEHPDLDLTDYLAAVGGSADVPRLRRDKVKLVSSTTEDVVRQWTAYRCLIFQVAHQGHVYILSEAQWFEVARDFATDIEARLGRIPVRDLGWPPADPNEGETPYNARVAASQQGAILLDAVEFTPSGARSTMELADILTAAGELVHVKRKTSSSTLSHLFSQGRISAETLKRDPSIRQALAARLNATDPDLAARLDVDRLPARTLDVVYCIVAVNAADLPGDLPFFSKLNLVRSAEYLDRTLDFGIGVAFVPQRQ